LKVVQLHPINIKTSVYFLIGLRRYARIGVISDKVFALYYDHLGFIHKLAPDYFDAGSEIEAFGNTRTIFGKVSDTTH
jgi:cation channel sperm-associated protein subunit beta